MNNFHSLKKYIDSLPNPKTFKEKLNCLWSDFIDTIVIFKMKLSLWSHRGK